MMRMLLEIHCFFNGEAIEKVDKKLFCSDPVRSALMKSDPAQGQAAQLVVLARAVAGIYAQVLRESPERAEALLKMFIEDIKNTAETFDKVLDKPTPTDN